MKNEIVKASQLYIGNTIYKVSRDGKIYEDSIGSLRVDKGLAIVTLNRTNYLDFTLSRGENPLEYILDQEESYDDYFFDKKLATARAIERAKNWIADRHKSIDEELKHLKEDEERLNKMIKDSKGTE